MKGRTFFMFFIALALGISAAWLANKWVEDRTRLGSEIAGTPVVVAALDIPFGQKIEQAHVKVVEWPSGNTPKGAFSDPLLLEGRIAKQSFLPGEVILEERVVEHLGGSTLASIVEPNKRAVTVRVNDVIGVAGFLLPGNRVDILSTRSSSGRGNTVTETILQDVKVLAVDQTASTDKDRPVVVRAVTLELTPAEAELLVKATSEGTLQLTLRNPLDSELVAKKEEKKEAPKVERKIERVVYKRPVTSDKTNITVIRGTSTETVSVKNEPTVIRK